MIADPDLTLEFFLWTGEAIAVCLLPSEEFELPIGDLFLIASFYPFSDTRFCDICIWGCPRSDCILLMSLAPALGCCCYDDWAPSVEYMFSLFDAVVVTNMVLFPAVRLPLWWWLAPLWWLKLSALAGVSLLVIDLTPTYFCWFGVLRASICWALLLGVC